MADLSESNSYDAGVYQLETTDPVQGGDTGASNKPLKNLANRTKYLKSHVDALETLAATLAPLNSPLLTGNPTTPAPPLGDNDFSIAPTQFVQATIAGVLTKSVAGSANVTLTAVEAGNGILTFTGALTANINVIVPTSPTAKWTVRNQTSGAFTLTIKTSLGSGVTVVQGKSTNVINDGTNVAAAMTDYSSLNVVAKSGDKMTGAFDYATTVSLAIASTVAIGAAASNNITLTAGTGPIAAFDNYQADAVRTITLAAAATFTHNAVSLISPTAGDLVLTTGSVLEVVSLGGGNWRIKSFTKATNVNLYASQAANMFCASPNGSSGVPTFRSIAVADLPVTYTRTKFSQMHFNDFSEEFQTLSSGAINLALGNAMEYTAIGNTTFVVSGIPASGKHAGFILYLTNGGGFTIAWMSGTKWASGFAPALTVSGLDILVFTTKDGGVTWRGILVSKDSR